MYYSTGTRVPALMVCGVPGVSMVSSTLHTTVVWRAHLGSQVHVHIGLRFDPSSIRRKDLSASRGTCTCYRPLAGLLTPTNANTTCSSMGEGILAACPVASEDVPTPTRSVTPHYLPGTRAWRHGTRGVLYHREQRMLDTTHLRDSGFTMTSLASEPVE